MSPSELEEMLRPPTDTEVEQALARFAIDVAKHYGARLTGLYLFGSRARGDHAPDSDADVAVILRQGDWEEWIERRVLNGFAYEAGLESGAVIQPWPFSDAHWCAAAAMPAARLLGSARRDAIRLEAPR